MIDDNITPGEVITFAVDGEPLEARRGQTIAAALYTNGRRVLRATRIQGKPRAVYCAMGICFDCIVKVNGETSRACMRYVEDGMDVRLPKRFARAESER